MHMASLIMIMIYSAVYTEHKHTCINIIRKLFRFNHLKCAVLKVNVRSRKLMFINWNTVKSIFPLDFYFRE